MVEMCFTNNSKVGRNTSFLYNRQRYSRDQMLKIYKNNSLFVQVLITNKKIYFVNNGDSDLENAILTCEYPDLMGVTVVKPDVDRQYGAKVYLELMMKSVSAYYLRCKLCGTNEARP